MRPTLHDYQFELSEQVAKHNWSKTLLSNENFWKVDKFAKLTNRAPHLGDFVPCDEDGNVLEKPERVNYVIGVDGFDRFKEDWEQFQQAQSRVIFKGFSLRNYDKDSGVTVISTDELTHVLWFKENGKVLTFNGVEINRIEDLPREIEFKEGLI